MIKPGIYHNPNPLSDKMAFIEIRYTEFPSQSDFDGGLPGVAITWGREKMFVIAKDCEDFWNQWPYSIFKPDNQPRDSDRESSGRSAKLVQTVGGKLWVKLKDEARFVRRGVKGALL